MERTGVGRVPLLAIGKADCPYKMNQVENAKAGQATSGGSGSGSYGGKESGGKSSGGTSNGKGAKGSGGKGTKQSGGGKQQVPEQQPVVNKVQTTAEDKGKGVSTSSTSTAKEEQAGGQDQRASEKPEDMSTGGKNGGQAAGTGEAELMSEVTSLLKSMRLNGPRISAMALKRLEKSTDRTTLLDGGATHCLRPAASLQEWERSMERVVSLATGTVELRQVKYQIWEH